MVNSNLAEAPKATWQRVEHHLVTAAPAQPEDCADRAFAEAMIAHYESSIKTARLIQESGSDVMLRWLADAIIASHERDLDMLREWLRCCRDGHAGAAGAAEAEAGPPRATRPPQ